MRSARKRSEATWIYCSKPLGRREHGSSLGGNGHYKVYPPDPANSMVPIPQTPSGYKTVRNKRAQLKRNGIDPNTR